MAAAPDNAAVGVVGIASDIAAAVVVDTGAAVVVVAAAVVVDTGAAVVVVAAVAVVVAVAAPAVVVAVAAPAVVVADLLHLSQALELPNFLPV